MATATETEKWVFKEEAARLLGVKERQIEKRAQQGYIARRHLARLPTERQGRVQYRLSDIEALLSGELKQMGAPVKPAFPEGPSGDGTRDLARIRAATGTPEEVVRVDTARSLAEYLDKLAEHLTTLTTAAREGPKAFLTLEEASRYSGLPQPYIANLLRTDQVDHIGRGPVTWRIRRASLDGYGIGGGV